MDIHPTHLAFTEVGIEFVKNVIGLAHSSLDVSATAKLNDQRIKSKEDARQAYRGAMNFLTRLELSAEQKLDFDEQLAVLEERLRLAGIEP